MGFSASQSTQWRRERTEQRRREQEQAAAEFQQRAAEAEQREAEQQQIIPFAAFPPGYVPQYHPIFNEEMIEDMEL